MTYQLVAFFFQQWRLYTLNTESFLEPKCRLAQPSLQDGYETKVCYVAWCRMCGMYGIFP